MASTPTLSVLGEVLRALRNRAGLTQEALAHASGLHPTYVSGVERSVRNISFLNLGKLLDALGVSWGQFGREVDRRTGTLRSRTS